VARSGGLRRRERSLGLPVLLRPVLVDDLGVDDVVVTVGRAPALGSRDAAASASLAA
jgi:hypothetical protein